MSVTVVTGRSGSGKSRFLMKHISSLIKDPFESVLVLVPGQLTFETEKRILSECNINGILGLEVMSLQRLAFKVLEYTGSVSFISNAQKALYISRALKEERPFGDDIQDLEACTASLMSTLKCFNQTPETLKAAAAKITDAELSKKLVKTADVYKRYIELTGGRPDLSDIYTLAAAAAAKADFLKGAHVVIDGLNSASPAVMSFLTEVMRQARDTVAAFRSGGEGEGDLFSSEEKDMRRFIEAAKAAGKNAAEVKTKETPRYGCGELKFLEANLFRYPYKPYEGKADNIRLLEAQTIEDEVDMLCAGILEEVKGGRRFKDMAIVGGRLDAYMPAIKTKFAQCGIAYFFDERRTLADNTFFEFLHDALAAAAGDMQAAPGYIYSVYSPLEENERIELHKYARKYALRGWHYFTPFRWGEAERAEELRKKAIRPLRELSLRIKGKGVREQVEAVKRFIDICGAAEKLGSFVENLNGHDTRAEHEYFSQVYEKSLEALDGICEVYGDTPSDPRLLCSLLKTAFSNTKIALIPPSTDEVGVYDISTARLPDIDVLFAAGVHDGVWPAKDDGAGIMSRAERDALFAAGVDIGPYDPSTEKLKVYTALSKPKQRLYISHNAQSGQPSILIDRIKRLFPYIKAQARSGYTSLAGVKARVLGEMASALGGAQPDAVAGVCAKFLKQPLWKQKAQDMLLRTNAAIPAPSAAALYGGIRCSATRIEDYYRCPYKHFLDFGIKAQTERDYTNDNLDTGTFLHLALDIFTKNLLEENVDIKELSPEETAERMRQAAAEAAEAHDGSKLLSDERLALKGELLCGELVNAALRIRAHFIGSGACIYCSEQEFSDYSVDTEFGEIMITGKIDRIDAANGYFRVVDYKSSAADFAMKDFLAGVRIQLPVYLAAAQRLMQQKGEDLRPAGGYYMRIGDACKESGEAVAKEARLSGISLGDPEALKSLSAVNEDGSFAAIDQALSKSGELKAHGKNRFFKRDEMDKLLSYTDGLIKQAASAIYRGSNDISPAHGITAGNACAYCDYGSVCRMDMAYEGNAARQIESAELLSESEVAEDGLE